MQRLIGEREVRSALARLEELGYVHLSEDEVHITNKGYAVL
jgi:hypothetical protein